MSSRPSGMRPQAHSRGARSSAKTRREDQNPFTPSTRSKKLTITTRNALYEINQGVLAMDPSSRLPSNRIHHSISPQEVGQYPNYGSCSRKQTLGPRYNETIPSVSRPLALLPSGLIPLSAETTSDQRFIPWSQDRTPLARAHYSSLNTNIGLTNAVFSSILAPETIKPAVPPRPPSPYPTAKRSKPLQHIYKYPSDGPSSGQPQTYLEEISRKYPQGHRLLPRSCPNPPSYSHDRPEVASARDLEIHAKETAAAMSNLSSQVGSLNNTMAAVLPIVAEARLLWMENTVIRAPTKLGTSRQAFCQHYDSPKYLTYTRNVRARAHYLGLTLHDLEYLQERLGSLGEEHQDQGNARAVLVCPFGGGNESGDKIMVESFRSNSKHGIYARRIWRLCYERAYSVNHEWAAPIPLPDNSKLVTKLKTWLSSS